MNYLQQLIHKNEVIINDAEIDECAVLYFSIKMDDKLSQKRMEGRGGWYDANDCSIQDLTWMLREHVDKAVDQYGVKDPHQLVDLANLAMFLYHRTVTLSSEYDNK